MISPISDTAPITEAYARIEAMVSRHRQRDLRYAGATYGGDTRAARRGRSHWKTSEATKARIRELLARGHSQPQVARLLGIGLTTVKRYR